MKDNLVLNTIMSRITDADRILVYRHTNPDPDAIGAQMGLVQLLATAFPSKTVVAMAAVPQRLAWLGVTDEQSVTPQATDLVIAVDCANAERLEGQLPADALIIKIDHHPNRDPYGQLNWVDESYSSCSEMIYDLYAYTTGQLTMTAAVATALYAGIIGDTVRFSTPETSSRTLTIAASLATEEIDIAAISHHEMDLTPALSKLSGYALSHQVDDGDGLVHVIISQTHFEQLGLQYGEEDVLVPLLGNQTTAKVWLWFIETPEGNYRVHFRSRAIPVNDVAKVFDGGGHPLASGAFVPDIATIERVVQRMRAQVVAKTVVSSV